MSKAILLHFGEVKLCVAQVCSKSEVKGSSAEDSTGCLDRGRKTEIALLEKRK